MSNILDWKEYSRVARNAAAEGCVLLRNEQHALPIRSGETVSVFGRIQLDYYKSGAGSGGMVNVPYVHSILDGLRSHGSGESIFAYEADCLNVDVCICFGFHRFWHFCFRCWFRPYFCQVRA